MTISLAAEPLFQLGSFPVTNSLLATILAALFLVVLAQLITRRLSIVPGRFQAAAEALIEYLRSLVDQVTNDRQQTKQFFPIIATIFFFILTMNWMGLLPIFGTIGLNEVHEGEKVFVPLLRAGTADLNMTMALAMIVVILTQVIGVMYVGAKHHLRKYFNPNPSLTFVGIIEFVSEFTKIISFSFRLFGNVFAGEVLLLVISTLVPFIAPVPFYLLEIFVGFIQAFVFALLTLVFLKIAATAEEH